jgi:hypothetical protein
MRLLIQTVKRKQFDRVTSEGKWHKKFILFPRTNHLSCGKDELIFLEHVYRKAIWRVTRDLNTNDYCLEVYQWHYATGSDAVYSSLADNDILSFVNSDSERWFIDLREQLNEQ